MASRNEIIERVRVAGVVGAGGGGFPTHIKLAAHADVLIANGAECEVLCYSDKALMAAHTKEVLDGVLLAAEATGAGRVVLAVKEKHSEHIASFKKYLRASPYSSIELLPLADVYPVGDEFVLTFEATGRVVPQGGIPIDVGVVVQNVGTLYNVAQAMKGMPVIERMVSVAGEVPRPSAFLAPLGASFSELLRAAGVTSLRRLSVLDGGVMMGKLIDPARSFVSKTTTAISVLPDDSRAIVERSSSLDRTFRIAKSVCDQCTFCTELCPRYMLGHTLRPHLMMRRIGFALSPSDLVLTEAHYCSECGICTLYACPLGISPSRVNTFLKSKFARPITNSSKPEPRAEYWDRRLPSSRLKTRLGIGRYEAMPPAYKGRIAVERVNVLLRQHAGENAAPVVSAGARVSRGELLADVKPGVLGARIHAPIGGRVEQITSDAIVLTAE
ncbi:MAG TPA: 4Fe-4S dicluster domain-containing protein [bacterium]|nr:4Fe-4S dicluster domain-containing protein [bacterium]